MKQRLLFVCAFLVLLTGCSKQEAKPAPVRETHMSAQLNGRPWTTTSGSIGAWAETDPSYSYGPLRYVVTIHAKANNDLSAGGIKDCEISLDANYLPQVGRHYFNVNGATGQPLGLPINNNNFLTANLSGRWLDDSYFTAHAVDGFVDITEVADGQVRGTFEFNAPNRSWTATNGQPPSFKVESGTFRAEITGGGLNLPWNVAQ